MPKSAAKRQYGWRVYRNESQIIFTAGTAIQLEHGKRYQVMFEERPSGKCTAIVNDGFVSKRFNYPDRATFERDWVRQHTEPVVVG